MIYFTSDLHFYHENVIKHANRPFSNVEEMNQTLINNWNKKVGISDEIYILGLGVLCYDVFEFPGREARKDAD